MQSVMMKLLLRIFIGKQFSDFYTNLYYSYFYDLLHLSNDSHLQKSNFHHLISSLDQRLMIELKK